MWRDKLFHWLLQGKWYFEYLRNDEFNVPVHIQCTCNKHCVCRDYTKWNDNSSRFHCISSLKIWIWNTGISNLEWIFISFVWKNDFWSFFRIVWQFLYLHVICSYRFLWKRKYQCSLWETLVRLFGPVLL